MSDPVTRVKTPIRLEYTITAGTRRAHFLEAVRGGRLLGERCPSCSKVLIPAVGVCATCGVATTERVEIADYGIVTTFCVVNIQFEGQVLEPPYACAHVLLEGADTKIFHLVGGCAGDEVRMGMRVRAVWLPEDEREPTLGSIRYFEPTGEPDAEPSLYEGHL